MCGISNLAENPLVSKIFPNFLNSSIKFLPQPFRMSRQQGFDKNRRMINENALQLQLEEAVRQLNERDAQIAQLQEQNLATQQINALQQQMENLMREMQIRDNQIAQLQGQGRQPNEIEKCLRESQIPDTIKQLPNYNGDAKLLATWIDSVDRVLALYVKVKHTESYQIWLSQIRNKITEKANEALMKNHTPLVWENIKETLISYFGDKRDLSTLTGKIPYLKQKDRTLDDYYHEVEGLFADINANIHLDPDNAGHEAAIMRVLEVSIRNAFIDGLEEDIGIYTRSGRPKDLLQAYQIAQDYDNAVERRKEKFPHASKHSQRQPVNYKQNSIHPDVRLMNSYAKPPLVPKRNYQKFEKMEVDPSLKVNYMNRPRPPVPNNFRQQPKQPTQFKPYFGNNGQQPQNYNFKAYAPQQPRFYVEELTNTNHDSQQNLWTDDHSQYADENLKLSTANDDEIDDLNFRQVAEVTEET